MSTCGGQPWRVLPGLDAACPGPALHSYDPNRVNYFSVILPISLQITTLSYCALDRGDRVRFGDTGQPTGDVLRLWVPAKRDTTKAPRPTGVQGEGGGMLQT